MDNDISRRGFFSESTRAAAGLAAASAAVTAPGSALGANDRINLAIFGVRGRGREHFGQWTKIPGVRIAALCDIDENLFPERVKALEKLQTVAPKTETDLRRVVEDKEIDAVVVTNTNHWHALTSIWALQAGKDVYVEKPVSYTIFEGRKIVEAAEKYRRIVQTGSQYRSHPMVQSAIEFVRSGGIGKVYMAKSVVYRGRSSIGRGKVTDVPPGVNFDLWLGPAPVRPFIDNRFHYNWHWYWDTGNGETGNNGPHSADMIRWALGKNEHPRRVQSMGGMHIFDCDQETPNTQMSTLEYGDGTLVQLEVRNLFTNLEGSVREGVIFFGALGRVELSLNGRSWTSYLGRNDEPGPGMTREENTLKYDEITAGGLKADPHFVNFIDCLRSRKAENLAAPITEGHMAASICHLCNIAYRTGKTLTFDSKTESFPNDRDAQALVSREYRKPFVVPERV
ncbi:MAG: Gfo/Idh/MocA family protein [Candidatus Latescibacterota bacterium]